MSISNESTGVVDADASFDAIVSSIPPTDHDPGPSLPDHPLVSIRASEKWSGLDLHDLWSYRELFYFLMLRDVKVRYKQTLLGATWIVLQPVLTMLVFTMLFGRLIGVPSDGVPYPLFAFAGLLPWTLFSNAVTSSGNSLVGSANLITKVYFPRIIIPGAAVGARLVDFAIAFLILVGLMVYFGVKPTWGVALLPLLMVLTVMLALGAGMWLSALNVKYRDVGAVLPFAIQILFFATPIIYPASLVPDKWKWVMRLNPLTGLLDGYRASLFGRRFDWPALAFSSLVTLVLLIYSAYVFRRMERS